MVLKGMYHTSKGAEYYNPKYAWELIKDYIPKDKVLYEPFNNSKFPKSQENHKHLTELGFKMRELIPFDPDTGEGDFFKDDGEGWEVCVTNPPFGIKQKIVKRLVELDKPFILLAPTTTITNKYIYELGEDLQVIIPRRRIDFYHEANKDKKQTGCCFPVVFICYKIGLEKSLTLA